MQIRDSVALVTGANRGLGLAFARALLERGARRVYAAARDPRSVTLAGVIPLQLDVTDPAQVAAVARAHPDVTLLVNNAGVAQPAPLLDDAGVAALRAELETNVFGPLRTSRAFAPILAANGGGALLNVLSVLSWVSLPALATYAASKAAAWSLTNALRNELRTQGTTVTALHVGYMDTDMAHGIAQPKTDPLVVAHRALDGVEHGALEVLADEVSQQVKQSLSSSAAAYLGAV